MRTSSPTFLLAATLCLSLGVIAQAPEEPAARADWIGARMDQVRNTAGKERDDAIAQLVQADKEGDCVQPLAEAMRARGDDLPMVTAIVRGLGVDGVHTAAPALVEQLEHDDVSVRANVAVSLEYVGSSEKPIVDALRKAAAREKDEVVANHLWRALGRCGRGDNKVRSTLLKEAERAKTEFASYGPLIGLAYFDGDEKAARGVEKLLKKIGIPGAKGMIATNVVKRALASWTLARVGGKKSAAFVREDLLGRLENLRAPWVQGVKVFWELVASHLEGPEDRMGEVEQGVRGSVSIVKTMKLDKAGAESRSLMDDARNGRTSEFVPVGDKILGG